MSSGEPDTPSPIVARGWVRTNDPVLTTRLFYAARGMVWQSECLARIDPADGRVTGWVQMGGITAHTRDLASGAQAAGMDVLNGIAYSESTVRIELL
eukprot:SAG22_NODE_3881_length_1485_cov_1.352092_2_plen_97_part_00